MVLQQHNPMHPGAFIKRVGSYIKSKSRVGKPINQWKNGCFTCNGFKALCCFRQIARKLVTHAG